METYSQEEIAVFEARLRKMKANEEYQLQLFEEQLKLVTENGKDENNLDTTSYSTQVEKLISAMTRLKKHLIQVNNALLRIQNKAYGVCAETGHLIAKERLIAVPTTTLSMEGKKIRERKRGSL